MIWKNMVRNNNKGHMFDKLVPTEEDGTRVAICQDSSHSQFQGSIVENLLSKLPLVSIRQTRTDLWWPIRWKIWVKVSWLVIPLQFQQIILAYIINKRESRGLRDEGKDMTPWTEETKRRDQEKGGKERSGASLSDLNFSPFFGKKLLHVSLLWLTLLYGLPTSIGLASSCYRGHLHQTPPRHHHLGHCCPP